MAREDGSARTGWLGTLGILIGALTLALMIQWIFVKPYRIPSDSMVPTLQVGQRVLVDRLSEKFTDPKPGQVIVFRPPAGADVIGGDGCGVPRAPGTACVRALDGVSASTYIKRVAGVGGDRLEIRDGLLWRNGRKVDEPYAQPCADELCNLAAFTVPAGHYFMMGDNRGNSSDSRVWGPLERDNVIGRAFATYWPVKRIGGL